MFSIPQHISRVVTALSSKMAAMLAPMRFVQECSFASGDALPVTLSSHSRSSTQHHQGGSAMEAVVPPSPGSPVESMRPRVGPPPVDELDDDDEELDETLTERLWGLTEMFPDSLRTVAGATCVLSIAAAKKMYSFSRAALWVGTTSFMILVLPVVFETEKLQMEQHQQLQQRQILLGPTAGMSGSMPSSLPPMPGKL